MEHVNNILKNQYYLDCIEKNGLYEKDRSFCRHDMSHFLDVARIAMIINLEENAVIEKEIIYAAALLHDVGRFVQYENKTPHEIASSQIAPQILRESGFDEKITDVINEAILNHRNGKIASESTLRGILYRADKQSRSCFNCKAEKQCDWKINKKNMELII